MKTFECACCRGEFTSDEKWTQADKEREMKSNIGTIPEDTRATVCDGCYGLLMALYGLDGGINIVTEKSEVT